jgi:acetoin:2,6-dichlorophenolindophenol oxidoreductase subunit alpha
MSKGMLGANAIVGGSPPIAVGAALTQKVHGTGRVAVAFSGDGASNQGTTFEAMNMAVVLKAPAIFAFENNGYGEFTAAAYSVGGPSIAERAQAFGLPAERVVGGDLFGVRVALGRAHDHARGGLGPYALEIVCSRFRGHYCGDPQSYRGPEELAAARRNDPLVHFRERVIPAGLLTQDAFDQLEAEVLAEIDDAVALGLAAPPPPLSALTTDVYVRY